MRITPDTNVLVRAVINDEQGPIARSILSQADIIALPLSALCEFVWVLRSTYKRSAQEISAAVVALIEARNVEVNQAAARAGVGILLAGGDFADGVIAFEGGSLGGETFITFDRKAAKLVQRVGRAVQLLPPD